MRLILDAPDLAAARVAAGPELAALLTPEAFHAVKGVASLVDHSPAPDGPDAALARLARQFDAAAAVSPEAAAALYSLGDPARLDAAAAEVAAWLRAEGLHRPGGRVLEVGCGAGRFLRALAPDAAVVIGGELSPALAREAARRTAGLAHVRAVLGDGRGLPWAAGGGFDLVLYADSFPYVVQAGGDLSARHMAEAARVLAPGGRLAVLNWSYRGDPALDAAEAQALPRAAGLAPHPVRAPAFALWDGTAYVFAKPPRTP